MAKTLLTVTDLHVAIAGIEGAAPKEVVRGMSLTVREGEVHAIMGPNGSWKSTLVSALMGHPRYVVTSGSVLFCWKDLLAMEPHERAVAGLFLAFQYPRELSGVTVEAFLRSALNAQREVRGEKRVSPLSFQRQIARAAERLHVPPAILSRSLNKGFSGGEKKKTEILQLSVLQPKLALLDETDSGLDVDALRAVAEGVQGLRRPTFSAIIVTHYARILEHLTPDHVHVMVQGKIVESGGHALALRLEKEGYAKYGVHERKAVALEPTG